MSHSIDYQRLDVLLLTRLCTYGKAKRPSRVRVAKDLGVFAEGRLAASEWNRLVEERLQRLADDGFIEAGELRPSAQAIARVKEVLGLTRIPEWKSLKSKHLLGWMLGLPPKDAAKLDGGRVQARIICEAHDLNSKKAAPTLSEALDLWMWRQLGIDTDEKFSVGKARARLLERALSRSHVPPKTAEQGAIMAAAAIGAVGSNPEAIGKRIVQRSIFPDRSAKSPPVVAAPHLEDLAVAAQQAADTTLDDGRYNERKVFISAVWRQLSAEPEFRALSLDDFKEKLVFANQRGLLRLHRADLVGSMDASEVRTSEIKHHNATFHFIESQPRRSV